MRARRCRDGCGVQAAAASVVRSVQGGAPEGVRSRRREAARIRLCPGPKARAVARGVCGGSGDELPGWPSEPPKAWSQGWSCVARSALGRRGWAKEPSPWAWVLGAALEAFDVGNAGRTQVGLDLHGVVPGSVDKGDTGGLDVGLDLHGVGSLAQSTKGIPAAWTWVWVFMAGSLALVNEGDSGGL